jgi:hypothetical protein
MRGTGEVTSSSSVHTCGTSSGSKICSSSHSLLQPLFSVLQPVFLLIAVRYVFVRAREEGTS